MKGKTIGICFCVGIVIVAVAGYFHLSYTQTLNALTNPEQYPIKNFEPSQQPKPEPSLGGTVLGEIKYEPLHDNDIPISAEAGIILDATNNTVVYGKNEETPRPIASLTKLLTAIVYLEHTQQQLPTTTTTILPSEYTIGGTLHVEENEQLTATDLFSLMLVGSVNNTTNALVRTTNIGKEKFVDRMNQKAKELGLHTTRFTDPTGLDTTNQASPEDIARIANVAFQNPIIQTTTTLPEYAFTFQGSGREKVVKNTNSLIATHSEIPWTGSKTGYLDEAGWCLLVGIHVEEKNYIVAVLGAASKDQQFHDMLTLVEAIQNGTINKNHVNTESP